jgi:hypothetical protein
MGLYNALYLDNIESQALKLKDTELKLLWVSTGYFNDQRKIFVGNISPVSRRVSSVSSVYSLIIFRSVLWLCPARLQHLILFFLKDKYPRTKIFKLLFG